MMSSTILELAAAVIRKSSRERPADAVLRSELKSQRGLSPAQSTEVTNIVFAFFRWFGWLKQTQPINEQIAQAAYLSQRFDRSPESFPDSEIAAKAVPDW